MSQTKALYESYVRKMRSIADVKHACALLQWDQETYMPPNGASSRGSQISTLSEISHRMFSDDELGKLMKELLQKNDLQPDEKRNLELTLEDYEKNKKYSSAFVRQLSEQVNKCFHAWLDSRRKNDFGVYKKDLAALVELKKQETDILGYTGHPYNALVNEYEKGCTVDLLDRSFDNLVPGLKQLLEQISLKPQVKDEFLKQHYPQQEQWKWSMELIKRLHYDLESGRQDISEHPFSISFSSRDVRITTRIDEKDFGNMTWSCIHEAGHALYEQGLPERYYGLPLGEACSYSIHESQSRLWENHVGRGRNFWKSMYPVLQQHFPQQLSGISHDQFYKGINKVAPSLIRTEADEISYHFHVYIRYQLEKRLIEGSIHTNDIPEFWNSHYQQYLGVKVPDDRNGCLQDVHWSHGSFGYFPTYSLGSFYAAQFYETAVKQIPSLEEKISSGDSQELLRWLREKIHGRGRYLNSEDLCREVTGSPLNISSFMNYLLDKFGSIYNL